MDVRPASMLLYGFHFAVSILSLAGRKMSQRRRHRLIKSHAGVERTRQIAVNADGNHRCAAQQSL